MNLDQPILRTNIPTSRTQFIWRENGLGETGQGSICALCKFGRSRSRISGPRRKSPS